MPLRKKNTFQLLNSFQNKYVHLIPASFECANIDSADGCAPVQHTGFFSRAGPITTPTKGYVVFCSFPAGKFV